MTPVAATLQRLFARAPVLRRATDRRAAPRFDHRLPQPDFADTRPLVFWSEGYTEDPGPRALA